MIEFRSFKPRIAVLLNNQVEVTFVTQKHVINALENLDDSELTVTIKKYSKKRTLSQNAYLWVLLDEIGQKVGRSKEDVYKT